MTTLECTRQLDEDSSLQVVARISFSVSGKKNITKKSGPLQCDPFARPPRIFCILEKASPVTTSPKFNSSWYTVGRGTKTAMLCQLS